MSLWFRVHTEILHSYKVQSLPDHLFKFLINSWALAKNNQGYLPARSEIAFRLNLTPQQVDERIAQLVTAELIDKTPSGDAPHDWNGHQFCSDISTERTRKHRAKRRAEQVGNGEGTARERTQSRAEQSRDTENRAEQRGKAPAPANGHAANWAPDPQLDWCEAVYEHHPTPGKQSDWMIAARKTFWQDPDAGRNRVAWEANYPKWLATEKWQERNHKYVPLLINILLDGIWKRPPPVDDPMAGVVEYLREHPL